MFWRTPKLGTRGLGLVGGDDNFALGREGSPCGLPILVRVSLRWLKRVGAVVVGEGRKMATMIRRQIVEAKPINFILRCSPAAWLLKTIRSTQFTRQATKPMSFILWRSSCLDAQVPSAKVGKSLPIIYLRIADPVYCGGSRHRIWNSFKYLPHMLCYQTRES